MIRNTKWLILEEQVKGAAPEPEAGAQIVEKKSFSQAAERLGVSQSAISQSLARLRQLTSDELFQSTGRGMRETWRSQANWLAR